MRLKLKVAVIAGLFALCGFGGTPVFAGGGDRQSSSDFTTLASSGNVLITTNAWVAVPATASIDRSRWAILITNPSTNSSNMLWRITNDDLPPATTSYGHVLAPGQNSLVSISGFMRLWMISLNTSSENAFQEELK